MLVVAVWSAVAGGLGAIATAVLVRRIRRSGSDPEPELYWGLGLVAVTPAWLIEFLALLGSGSDPRVELRRVVLASIGVTMAGVIGTNAIVRRQGASAGRSPYLFWLLGMAAIVPTWALILVARLWMTL